MTALYVTLGPNSTQRVPLGLQNWMLGWPMQLKSAVSLKLRAQLRQLAV